ncbi:MAG: pentapeptide repeat-containing protein [Acidimicrobiia bacterium]
MAASGGAIARAWDRWRTRVANAGLIGLAVGVAVGIVQVIWSAELDDSRAERERKLSIEASWRLLLEPGAVRPGALLENLQLPGLYAPSVDLSATNASGVNLSKGTFTTARFDAAELRLADLSGSYLFGASLRAADLRPTCVERTSGVPICASRA